MTRRLVAAASVALAAAALVFGLWRALGAAWLADDSFISFRYAEQLVGGHGLVYNLGERVEGYTNLLWTLLVAAALRLGIPPEMSATALGLACWLALVGILGWRSWRRDHHGSFFPLAAMLVLLMEDFQTWATGGLETSLFTLLVVAGLLLADPAACPAAPPGARGRHPRGGGGHAARRRHLRGSGGGGRLARQPATCIRASDSTSSPRW